MKVYRLESDLTGGGPFCDGGDGTPDSWRYTHSPPNCGRLADTFNEWRFIYNLSEGILLPEEYLFAFNDIGKLIDAFQDFEELPHMKLYEIEIDTFYPEDHCLLPDGQVIFRLEKSRSLIEF